MVAWECPINPRKASGLDPEAIHGWGLLNVHRNQFVAPLGAIGPDADIFQTKDEAIDHFLTLYDQHGERLSHIRLVRVHLANEADAEAQETLGAHMKNNE